jgi:hypothetical protein
MKASIYTILYSTDPAHAVEPGYQILDNTDNPRPDWREYWPIRNFFLEHALEEDRFYGFFSPRFREKTGLSHNQVVGFIEQATDETDVALFSPQVDVGAFFPNVFAGEEYADSGFLAASQAFLTHIRLEVDLSSVLMNSTNIVFSNYIVARPVFWRSWLEKCEQLFQISEFGDTSDPLHIQINHKTNYNEGVPRKVFILERIASLILFSTPNLKVRVYNPFQLAWSLQLSAFKREAIICDALKIAASVNDFPEYRTVFESIQQEVLTAALGKNNTEILEATIPHDVAGQTLIAALPSNLNTVASLEADDDSVASTYLMEHKDSGWAVISRQNTDKPCFEIKRWLVNASGKFILKQNQGFDAWLLDGLPAQYDPRALLLNIKDSLIPGGTVAACITNAQHWRRQVRLSLGISRFDDDKDGNAPPAQTLSRVEIFSLFEQTGFQIESAISVTFPPPAGSGYLNHIRSLAQLTGGDPDAAEKDAMACQYVIRAVLKR